MRRPEHRHGEIPVRDVLVFVIISLVGLILIEGLLFSSASPEAQTVAVTYTTTTTFTLTSFSTAISDSTTTLDKNYTTTETDTSAVTSTVSYTSSYTTSITDTDTATTTRTETVTAIGPFVAIDPGSSNPRDAPGFSPSNIVVVIGVNSTVTWVNTDSVHHTVVSTSGGVPLKSGNLAPGDTYTFTFTVPGVYAYTCAYHPWMKGTITVRD